MRKFLLTVAFVMLPVAAMAATVKTVTLDVSNMTCPLCPFTVMHALDDVPGVTKTNVSFFHKTAQVTYDSDKANIAELIKATTDAGYPSAIRQ
ncbi:MAG: mercury resistance system periplasmic binding protein MerP [Alphaproteobacteria bacterium]|nr:mercury resistance system periplasmic binding protein MerP [Alphaproteobacteria bacterium]